MPTMFGSKGQQSREGTGVAMSRTYKEPKDGIIYNVLEALIEHITIPVQQLTQKVFSLYSPTFTDLGFLQGNAIVLVTPNPTFSLFHLFLPLHTHTNTPRARGGDNHSQLYIQVLKKNKNVGFG